jgi:hypothetical protein
MKLTPAMFYREASRKHLIEYRTLSQSQRIIEGELKTELEQVYLEYQSLIYNEIASGKNKSEILPNYIGLSIISMGIFAFGDFSKYSDIIYGFEISSNNKSYHKVHRLLGNSISAMIPIPESINLQYNTISVIKWLSENQDRFQWNEDIGRYIMM